MNATPPDAPPPSPVPPEATPPAAPGGPGPTRPREGWAVDAGRGVAWWTEGWRLFVASPLIWVVITLIYAAIIIGLHFIPFLGQIAATLLTPVLAAGVLLGCRKLDHGGELAIGDLFAGFGANVGPLMVLGLLWLVGWLLAVGIAALVLGTAFGFGALSSLWSGDPMRMLQAFGIGALVTLLLFLLIALPLGMAYWFAPALVALRNDEPLASLRTSFAACLRNVPPFLVYGLIFIVLAIVASVLFGLGWLVLGPVLATSLYASYKDIFGD